MSDDNNSNWFDNIEARPHPWPGLNWLTTMLYVEKVSDALEFYSQVFEFYPIFKLSNETETLIFARLRYRGCNFTLTAANRFEYKATDLKTSGSAPSFMFYLYVDNVDKTFKKAVDCGSKILQEPYLEFWGDRKARIEDPFGYIWDIATKLSSD